MDPNFVVAHYYLSFLYLQQGLHDDAISEAQKALALSGGENTLFAAILGYIYSMSGKIEKAKKVLTKLEKLSKQKYVSPYLVALIYLGLEQKEEALELIEKAYEQRDNRLMYLKIDPMLDPLRSDPRFKELLKKMNLE